MYRVAQARYTRKVKRLFQTIDDSGDGTINFQEFSKLVQSPKLKFWMAQLVPSLHSEKPREASDLSPCE